MEVLLASLREEAEGLLRVAPRLALALLVVLASLIAGRIAGRMLVAFLRRGRLSATHLGFFRALVVWGCGLVGLFVALNLMGLQGVAAGLLAGGGVTAVVAGFALRQIGENLLAGLFLAFSRPFELGDLIESGGLRGVVKEIQLRSTHVRTVDGRDIFIPSSQLFNSPLINFTKDGLRRLDFTIGIDYGDDVGAALRLVRDAVAGVDGVLETPAPQATISSFEGAWVLLEATFWIDTTAEAPLLPRVRSGAMEAARRALREAGITLSTDVTSNVALASPSGLDLRLQREEETASR